MQPRIQFTFTATKAHCWIILACCSLGPPGSFWQKYTPASQTPPCNGAWDCSVPGEGLPTDLTQFLSTQSSKLLRSLWQVASPSRISVSLSSLLLSASLVRKFSPVIQISVIKIVSDPITNSKEHYFWLATRLPLNHQQPPFKLSSLASFPPILWSYLSSLYLISLSGRILWETVSNALIKIKVDDIHSSSHVYRANCFTAEDNQVGQAW